MNTRLKTLVLRLLEQHRVMAIATNRPDGWPHATMVGYVNDGFLLYSFIAGNSQKYTNVLRDPRVSIAIASDATEPLERFPGRLNREGFPRRHESDSRFALGQGGQS